MTFSTAGGFQEQPHTADWALEVWAPDLIGLLQHAAHGMYGLMQARLQAAPRETYRFEIAAPDRETLLVTFLAELLYFTQRDGVGFDQFDLIYADERLTVEVEGAPIEALAKEIKAVTFHNLAVRETARGLEATIVFDV
ncbi:MAG: archease [Chloroflexi bacterium]|nr:archease [Chloroflexota bacterium]